KHGSSYRFKIDKRRFSVDLEVFREILQICPRLPDQDFDELPSQEEIPSIIRLLLHRKMFLQRSLQEYSQLVYKSKISLAALLEDAQMKKVLKWSKRENHSLQVSGLGTSEGTDVNDDGHDDDIDDDGNDDESDDDGNNNASDDEKTESGDDENPNLNKKDDDKEEEYEEEYVHTPEKYESTNDESEHMDEEEYDRINEELYNDVNVKLTDVEYKEEG
ncbi:hypothetical protein Tco_1063504, partial [Tanacetum coccineum]